MAIALGTLQGIYRSSSMCIPAGEEIMAAYSPGGALIIDISLIVGSPSRV
jgi:hypothetical protein